MICTSTGCGMNFYEVTGNKKQYLDLLLLADEQEDMIDHRLSGGARAGTRRKNDNIWAKLQFFTLFS